MDKSSSSADPCEVVILVAPNYSQLTLAALVEPLRKLGAVSARRQLSHHVAQHFLECLFVLSPHLVDDLMADRGQHPLRPLVGTDVDPPATIGNSEAKRLPG